MVVSSNQKNRKLAKGYDNLMMYIWIILHDRKVNKLAND